MLSPVSYSSRMGDAPLLRDMIDAHSVDEIAAAIAVVVAEFDERGFVAAVFDQDWEERAFKQRIRHIAVTARDFIGGDYTAGLAVLRKAALGLPSAGLAVWCLNDFVEEFGVDAPDQSLPALEQFTKIASAEFAVRPFIRRYPEMMAAQMLKWARSDDPSVRRLASEGFRPRLRWGMGLPRIKRDPSPVLPVLELLRSDPSETVRRSVANNLNDISKDHPEIVVATPAKWGGETTEAVTLRKHPLRTLLKKGHAGAMELLGFAKDAAIKVVGMAVVPPTATVGEHVVVEFQVVSTSDRPQQLMIDYAVVYQTASGTGSRKVFKGKVEELGAGASVELRRKVSLRQMTTRRICPGPHLAEAQVNGVVRAAAEFDVVE